MTLTKKYFDRAVIKSRWRGISSATMNVAPGYFHCKINEKQNQKKSLAVWFPAYLLYVPGNLNLSDNPASITSSEDSMQASSLFSVAREGSHEPRQNTKVVLIGDFPRYLWNAI